VFSPIPGMGETKTQQKTTLWGGFLLCYTLYMFAFIFKIWWMIAVLPFLVLIDGSKKFSNYLKRKNIYKHWDLFHTFIIILIILAIILYLDGFR
jgi:hypothetical protein